MMTRRIDDAAIREPPSGARPGGGSAHRRPTCGYRPAVAFEVVSHVEGHAPIVMKFLHDCGALRLRPLVVPFDVVDIDPRDAQLRAGGTVSLKRKHHERPV